MTLATSKNLTIVGICMIVGAVAAAAVAIFDGDPTTNVNWELTLGTIVTGFGFILGKGAASTGGMVDGSGKPVAQWVDAVVQIVGLASRFLMSAGVPPVAVFAGCIVLAVLLILAPPLAQAAWTAIRSWQPPEPPDRPGDSPDFPNPSPQEGPPSGQPPP